MCPACGIPHDRSERFCRDCGLPLVLGDGRVLYATANHPFYDAAASHYVPAHALDLGGDDRRQEPQQGRVPRPLSSAQPQPADAPCVFRREGDFVEPIEDGADCVLGRRQRIEGRVDKPLRSCMFHRKASPREGGAACVSRRRSPLGEKHAKHGNTVCFQ